MIAARARVAFAVGIALLVGLFAVGQMVQMSAETVAVVLVGILGLFWLLDRWVGR